VGHLEDRDSLSGHAEMVDRMRIGALRELHLVQDDVLELTRCNSPATSRRNGARDHVRRAPHGIPHLLDPSLGLLGLLGDETVSIEERHDPTPVDCARA